LVAIILIGSNGGKDKKQAGAELCQAHLRLTQPRLVELGLGLSLAKLSFKNLKWIGEVK
jgi:hypothetical protein